MRLAKCVNNKNIALNWIKIIFSLSYIFVTLPFLIFALGYFKIWLAIPIGSIILFSLLLLLKGIPNIEISVNRKYIFFKIMGILAIISVWVFLSGIGKVAWQNTDHNARNGVYEALVNYSWPVGHGYLSGEGTSIGMMVYYIGFWMVPALFGKIFGVEAGYLFQVFWAILGLTLLYFLICIWRKKISIWPLIVFIFFSGMDIVFNNLFSEFYGKLFSTDFIEYSVGRYSYSSINVSVSAVFNQSIIAWIVTILLLLQNTHKNLVFLLSTVMLSATFPFIGLIPLVIYWTFSKYSEDNKIKELHWLVRAKVFLKSICTFQNIIGGGVIGIISFLYLKGNNSAQVIQEYANKSFPSNKEILMLVQSPININLMSEGLLANVDNLFSNPIIIYISFIILEVGVYFILVFKRQKFNPLYYIILGSLMIIPFVQVGYSVDFCMRASIPGIFILYLYVIEYLSKSKKNIYYITMILVLTISSVSAFHEMGKSLQRWGEKKQTAIRVEDICSGGNFGGSPNNFFFQHISKPLPQKELKNVLIEYCNFNEDEFYVKGPTFSVEKNSLVASEMVIELDRSVSGDVLFEDSGMLDDNSVFYQVFLNEYYMGSLDYNHRELVFPQECFTPYAQKLRIVINKEVKLYSSDSFRMYALYESVE